MDVHTDVNVNNVTFDIEAEIEEQESHVTACQPNLVIEILLLYLLLVSLNMKYH